MSRRHVATLLCGLTALGMSDAARADDRPTTDQALAALRLADPALKIELVASEPAVVGPVAMAWDEFGRLFVVEMTDYPDADTGGRIKRLEDRDGDGRYEHVTTFADGLKFPSGVLPWNGGILVTAAPNLLYFRDTDGDGKADVRHVVLTGFGEGNQQLRVNSPTWGLDNWVYLANGRSGGSIRRPSDPPEKAVAIPRNDLRLKPATGEFEKVAGFSQFGLPRDDWGDRFPSWNTVPIRHVVLEERVLARSPLTAGGPTVADILDLADGGRIFSLAPTQTRFNNETVAYFNATCGPTIYRAELLGPAYAGHAFVSEPLTSVVHHRRLDPAGVTFSAKRVETGREFLASSHPWFRPVNLATGPDGALYVADFSRALVEHPAFVPENRRKEVDFREGHEQGRIWRISPKAAPPVGPMPKPGGLKPDALVAELASPNGWRRDTAQRLLVERNEKAAIPTLNNLLRQSPSPVARVHALRTLEGLNALGLDAVRLALRDPDPKVREQGARLAGGVAKETLPELTALVDDPDPRVRLRTAVALGGVASEAAREGLAKIAARDADSEWVASAILSGLGEKPGEFLATLAARQRGWLDAPTPAQARFLVQVGDLIGRTNREPQVVGLLDQIAGAKGEPAAFALLLGLARGQAGAKPPLIDWKGPGSGAIAPGLDRARAVIASAFAAASAEDRPAWARALALELALETDAAKARTILPTLLESARPIEVQSAAARGVARVADAPLAAALLKSWSHYTLASRRVLLDVLVSSPALAGELIGAVEAGTVGGSELGPSTSDALRRLTDAGLKSRIEAILKARPVSDRRAVVARFESALMLKAEVGRGREVFAKQCQTCHAREGKGAKVGPDLGSVAGRPKPDLLVAILDPSREVAPDGVGVVVETTDGRTYTGLVVEESAARVRLRRAEGIEDVIPRGEIEALRSTGKSLMPEGLEQVLSPQDLADLVAYLGTAVGP